MMAQYIGLLLRSLLLLSVLNVRLSSSAPVKVTFDGCSPIFSYEQMWYCCPAVTNKPVHDFKPVFNSSRPIRIRRGLQCLDEEELAEYKMKLVKAYMILNALPDDDPRSLKSQANLHCAISVGTLDNSGAPLDVHFGWLFHPWHRWFLYFHEKIVQSVLGDPSFTMHFWNWDNDGIVIEGRSKGCTKAGNTFPSIYADPSSPLYHQPRSWRAADPSSLVHLDLTWIPGIGPSVFDPQSSDDAAAVLARNSEVMAFWFNGNCSTRTFYGRSYRAGESIVDDHSWITSGGLFELLVHASVHEWVGGEMGPTGTAARDPVFYAHHGNVERLWEHWMRQAPDRLPQDPDFLDAEFLFYDENGDKVRVTVRDVLDTRVLGYEYEQLNDATWNYHIQTEEEHSVTFFASSRRKKGQKHQ